ncbi:hypothetical protein PSY29_23550, partial [Shigella flexneri]|nr:hypothetical protein [Shigella flexneri]
MIRIAPLDTQDIDLQINCIAKLFLNAAIDLQVDILRIEWGC